MTLVITVKVGSSVRINPFSFVPKTEKNMVIAWFSCGITSAVACKIALNKYDDVRIIYIETGSAHSDNERFIGDCERWFGKKIERRRSEKYNSVEDVLRDRKYINGVHGAPCTLKLKKEVRFKIEDELKTWDAQVFGFDFCEREINRAIRFNQQYPSAKAIFPLIERRITKEDALGILGRVGIKIPKMYTLGYSNNNCIGCVKGGIGYWNKIRRDFPDVFRRMSKLEREIGHSCLHDKGGAIFLDELNPTAGKNDELQPSCSLFCDVDFADIIDPRTNMIIEGTFKL